MVLAVLVGAAYVVWLAWVEGWRLWVVAGVMVLVALAGAAVHLAMGMARERDGLGATFGETRSEEPSGRDPAAESDRREAAGKGPS
jgi:hypothetical protein